MPLNMPSETNSPADSVFIRVQLREQVYFLIQVQDRSTSSIKDLPDNLEHKMQKFFIHRA